MANSLLSACLPRCLTLLGLRRGSCLSLRVVDTGVLIIVGTWRMDPRRSVRPFSLYFDFLPSFSEIILNQHSKSPHGWIAADPWVTEIDFLKRMTQTTIALSLHHEKAWVPMLSMSMRKCYGCVVFLFKKINFCNSCLRPLCLNLRLLSSFTHQGVLRILTLSNSRLASSKALPST